MKEAKLPNFFIVGAAKAGTTFLYYFLKQHPQIYMSPLKEPHYFSDIHIKEKIEKRYIYKRKDYLALFMGIKGEKAIGEASVSYLCYESSPYNIKRVIPRAKIIIILRNPIERAFSHFLMDIRDGKLPPDAEFIETVKNDYYKIGRKGWGHSNLFIEFGMYYEQVKRYLEIFGKENVSVNFFEDLKQDKFTCIKNIFKFLDVDEGFRPDSKVKSNAFAIPRSSLLQSIYMNGRLKNLGRKLIPDSLKEDVMTIFLKKADKPVMKSDDRYFLWNIYEKDIQNLGELLEKDLTHWRYEE